LFARRQPFGRQQSAGRFAAAHDGVPPGPGRPQLVHPSPEDGHGRFEQGAKKGQHGQRPSGFQLPANRFRHRARVQKQQLNGQIDTSAERIVAAIFGGGQVFSESDGAQNEDREKHDSNDCPFQEGSMGPIEAANRDHFPSVSDRVTGESLLENRGIDRLAVTRQRPSMYNVAAEPRLGAGMRKKTFPVALPMADRHTIDVG
jgi:hypothetical protein